MIVWVQIEGKSKKKVTISSSNTDYDDLAGIATNGMSDPYIRDNVQVECEDVLMNPSDSVSSQVLQGWGTPDKPFILRLRTKSQEESTSSKKPKIGISDHRIRIKVLIKVLRRTADEKEEELKKSDTIAMTKRKLPSDPEFLLKYMDDIDSDFSDDEFQGYVDEDEEAMDVSEAYIHELGGACVEMAGGIGAGVDDTYIHGACMEVVGCNDVTGGVVDDVVPAFQSEVDIGNEETTLTSDAESDAVVELSDELKIPEFTEKCGVVKDLSGKQPVDYFFELFHDELQDYIVDESNRYGQQYIDNHQAYLKQHRRARANEFVNKPFTRIQFRLFLSLIICMGIVNMPNIHHYWNTSWPFANNNFNEIMSRDRFLLYLKFLHLADNSLMIPMQEEGHDKLFKVRHFLSTLIESYQKSYKMEREISVDEMMIKYKGRLSFLQYMPKKPHKWGIKAWALAEAGSGYCWNFAVYTGKDGTTKDDALGTRVVLDLVKNLAGKGHHVYFDNYYTSPTLCHKLHTSGFGCCGTLRLDRKGIPPSFRAAVLRKGEVVQYTDGEILGLKWKDKKDVSLLTTIHNGDMISIKDE
eukprot:Em0007g186a